MGFCWSTLNVKSLEESISFYRDIIGLDVVNEFSAGPQKKIVFLGKGETKIELICDEQNQDIQIGKDISWGFEVDSLDKTLALVKENGIQIKEEPYQPSKHTRFFFIQDPDGMTIQIVENIE